MLAGDISEFRVLDYASKRIELLRTHLVHAEATARRASKHSRWLMELADWIAEARDGLILRPSVLLEFKQL